MKISIVGTGYVGLVTGTCFAEMGNEVICVDIDLVKIKKLEEGVVPIYEPGLELLIERNLKLGRLQFTTDLKSAVQKSDIVFLALPTPPGTGGSADLSYVLGVAKDLSYLIQKYTIIVNKSTVPVGTAEKVDEVLSRKLPSELYDVVSNPEFLREGAAVQDFMRPDRVVIGCSKGRSCEIMERLYKPFVPQGNPIFIMDVRSAELTKYAANSYLAMRISYMNEIANLCDKVGANVDDVRRGMGADSRIGKRFLFPGIGYGGSCFPKDVRALHQIADQQAYNFQILDAVMSVNAIQKSILFDKITNHFGEDLKGKRFAIWGLSFKPETDDIREAPSLVLIEHLKNAGADIIAFDPEAMTNVKSVLGDQIKYAEDPYQALHDVDALAICTEWSIFKTVDLERLRKSMRQTVIFDGRNILDPEEMSHLGINYYSIGRPTI